MTARQSIFIGPWDEARERVASLADGARLPVVTDRTIWDLHGSTVSTDLDVEPLFVPPGEDAKSWHHLERLVTDLAAMNHARSSPVLALGGGSVGDLAGLAASLYRRGVPLIQLPTTLLAQVDSAIGGKTAIDAAGEKNLVGSFHPAALVVVDPAFLRTLDDRQVRSGIAEIIKYGAIGDAAFFGSLEHSIPQILAADPDTCREVIGQCIAAKQAIVADDPHDRTGRRALLNFGHTFGHAIESERGHGIVLHGEAVAVGMVLAAAFSEREGRAPAGTSDRIAALLESAGLPVTLDDVGLAMPSALLPWMIKDKKNAASGVTLILLDAIGDAVVETVEADTLARFLGA